VNISPRLSEPTTIGDYRHVWEFVRKDQVRVKGDIPRHKHFSIKYMPLYPGVLNIRDCMQDTIVGYLATAAYATPQDALFEAAPFKPLVLFFHALTLTRRPVETEGQ
jgi:hypothetical protein